MMGLTNSADCPGVPDGMPGAVGSAGLTTGLLGTDAALVAPAKTDDTTAQLVRPVVFACVHVVALRAVVAVCCGMYWPVAVGQLAVPDVTTNVLTMYLQVDVQEPVVGAVHDQEV